jgi:hypothetical protein
LAVDRRDLHFSDDAHPDPALVALLYGQELPHSVALVMIRTSAFHQAKLLIDA